MRNGITWFLIILFAIVTFYVLYSSDIEKHFECNKLCNNQVSRLYNAYNTGLTFGITACHYKNPILQDYCIVGSYDSSKQPWERTNIKEILRNVETACIEACLERRIKWERR